MSDDLLRTAITALESLYYQNAKIKKDIESLSSRIDALEQPATVAPDAGLHPVALLLAQAYRLAYVGDDVESATRELIRLAWCDVTGNARTYPNLSIMEYGR